MSMLVANDNVGAYNFWDLDYYKTASCLCLLRFCLIIGGGLGGQIFNFPLKCSTTSLQGGFVVVEKLFSSLMFV